MTSRPTSTPRRRSTTGIRRPSPTPPSADLAPELADTPALPEPTEPPTPAEPPALWIRNAEEPAPSSRCGSTTREGEAEGEGGVAARRPRFPAPPRTRRGTVLLAGATVLLLALATLAGVGWWTLRGTQAARNTALVDVATTAQVAQQLGEAVTTVYSYDFTRLDQNEAAAREVITPEFGEQFDRLFAEVRRLAPQQQAVVTATVARSAVESIDGDTAVLLVFLDQQATRAAGDPAGQQVAASGRLTVTGTLVGDRWRIAAVDVS